MIRYEKTIWENDKTPVNAQHLSKVEDGLEYLFDVVKDVPAGEDARISNEKQRQVNETTRQNNEIKRNDTLNAKVKEVDNAIVASNNNIKEVNNKFETIVASKQQDAEVILARGKYHSLSVRFDNLDKDLLNVKDTAIIPVSTENNFVTVEETTNGYLTNFKIEGKTLIVNSQNEEVEAGTEGAILKSVGDDLDEIVISSVKGDGNLFDMDWFKNHRLDHTYVNSDHLHQKELLPDYKYSPNTQYKVMIDFVKVGNIEEGALAVAFDYTDSTNSVTFLRNGVVSATSIPNKTVKGCYISYDVSATFNIKALSVSLINVDTIVPIKQDKKKVLYYDTETQTWKKPILRKWDSIEEYSNGKYYYHQRSEKRVYQEHDETNLEVITDKTNTVYKLDKEKVFECTPIDLMAFENATNYMIGCGAVIPKSSFKYEGNIGNVINTLKEKVSYLEDKLYKANLANFTVALNALDTKLKLEELTKIPK